MPSSLPASCQIAASRSVAGLRAASSDGDAPCAPALACDNHESFIAEPPFRLEYERRNCVPVESAAAYLADILRQRFFGRVQKKLPGDVLEYSGRVILHRLQHQPHHHRAAFDVVRAGAV